VAHVSREQRDAARQSPGGFDDVRFRRFWGGDPPETGRGECMPPVDVLETPHGVEIVVDLPGVKPSSVRIVFAKGTVLVAGEKVPAACAHKDAAFHLAERSFGRFARAVRLAAAFDAGRARATLAGGELRISLPRIEERRGREIVIPIGEP
jgi:HSP20 family protein